MRVYVPLSHKVFKEGRELSWRQTRRVPLHHLPQLFKRRLPLGVRERVGGQLHLHSRPSNHSRCFLPLPCSPPHSTVRASATLSPATLSGPVPLCLPQHCPGQCHSVSRSTVRASATLSPATLSGPVSCLFHATLSGPVSCLSHATLSGPVPLCLMQHCQLKTVRFSTSVVTALCFAPSLRQLWPVCFVSHHSPRAVVMYTYVLLFSLTGKSVHPPLCRRYGPTRFRSDHHVVL